MCKKIIVSAVAAFFALLFVSCDKKEQVKLVDVSISVDETALGDSPKPDSYKVKCVNVASAQEFEASTEGGKAVLKDIITGIYNITVSGAYLKGGFSYNYIGTLENVEIKGAGLSFSVGVKATKASSLIFKSIYYTGSKLPESGSYFRDQFYEIYNNGEATVYADGLCIGTALSSSKYKFPDNKVPSGNASDYIFFQAPVWQLPGDGDDYPIAPGESFIIAQYATNHTTEDKNPNSIDLSTSEFEAYIDDFKAQQTDCNAINMKLVCHAKGGTLKQWLTPVAGSAMVLFYPSVPIKNTDYIESSNVAPNTAREVLKSDVLDAVDCVKNSTADKRLETTLDAGKIWCSGMYVKESIVRKEASKKEDGRIIYQDTNNTSEDFTVSKNPEIRANGAKRPSWSTWTTAQ